ncbi:hypothetical protein [Actinopolymorpha pittospori]|uniref:Uncharacterized protein n=1 Tax=Actinopolymorpha pittospori TaxID=648752 RepID=A0A927N531_9ACTN|nr:hypothetical protein [Actinopolymorpha pittospori]MBE1612254.1 hypothetical protein [Actinopolymorpha pittospori]
MATFPSTFGDEDHPHKPTLIETKVHEAMAAGKGDLAIRRAQVAN